MAEFNPIMQERFSELERLARAAGLDPYDVIFFNVPVQVIYEVSSYGLPTRYAHWSFGRVYKYQKTQGEMGMSKIYELILNNNPSYAFLDRNNPDTINLLVAAHCYLPGTYVQTSDGLKSIEEIKPNDNVFDASGRTTHVIHPTYNVYDGEVVTIQAGGYKFTQTEDHKLFAIKTQSQHRRQYRSWAKAFENIDYKPEWVEASQLKPGDFLIVNKPKRDIERFEHKKLRSIRIEINKTLHNQNVVNTLEVPLDEGFGELVGLYLAEGYARPKGQMGLCFHAEETSLHEMSLAAVQKYFNLDGETKIKENSAVVEFNEICIAAYLRDTLGHSCYSKHLPANWLIYADLSFLRGVLRGFLLGDGTKCYDRSMGYTTTSPLLAMQIQHIAMMCGIYFGLAPRDGSTDEQSRAISYVGSCCGIYDSRVRNLLGMPERETNRTWSGVIETDKCFYVKINSVSSEDYSGIVHCMEVAGQEHSFTLANGIVTHNCYAHSDFFKNNVMFRQAGETKMIEVAKRHAEQIDQYRKDFGDDEVDMWLDIALSLERHVDVYKGRKRQRYPARHVDYVEREVKEWEDVVDRNRKPLVEKVLKGLHIPPNPERDILWFLSEYANLEPWQQHIFDIVRRESYYFYPQYRTKIMNEGWASYWHAELMRQYSFGNANDYGVTDLKHPLTSEEHLDFAAAHEKVVQAGVKLPLKVETVDPQTGKKVKIWNPIITRNPHNFRIATRLNPYYMGFRIYRDIKERWDKYYEQGYMEDEWENKVPVHINGDQKIRQVMMEEDDVSFLRNYLTEELAEKLHLFGYGNNDNFDDNYGIQEGPPPDEEYDEGYEAQSIENKTIICRTKDVKEIIASFARGMNNYGVPEIVVRRVDETGMLRLEHVVDDKTNVDIGYAKHVLKYVWQAWGRRVELVRKARDRTWIMTYDGDSDMFEIDHQTPDYPESIEDGAPPSSW